MQEFIIDPEFRDKIPPLTAEEFSKLEENILADGEVREPLVLWNDTIIDGHHRWKIIQKHPEIPYKVKRMDFPDKWAATAWICKNQLGRRNLTPEQKTYLAGKQYEAEKKSSGGQTDNKNAQKRGDQSGQLVPREKTRQRIARETGTSEGYVQRAEIYARGIDQAEKVSPGFRDSVLSGEIKAPQSMIRDIVSVPEEKLPDAVGAIKDNKLDDAREIMRPLKPYKPVSNATPVEARPPYNLDDFKSELEAVVHDIDASFKQTLVLAHREMLDTEQGRDIANNILKNAHEAVKKYEDMILRIKEISENENC